MINVSNNRKCVMMSRDTIAPIQVVPYIILYINGKPYMRYQGPHHKNEISRFVVEVSKNVQNKQKLITREGEESGKMTPPTAADVETGDKSVGGEETGKMTPPTAADVSTEQKPEEDKPADKPQTDTTPAPGGEPKQAPTPAEPAKAEAGPKPDDKKESAPEGKSSGDGQAAIQVKSKDGAVKTSTITKNTDEGMEVTIRVMIPPGAQHIVTGDAGDSTTTTLKGMATAINQGGGTRKHTRPGNKKTRRLH